MINEEIKEYIQEQKSVSVALLQKQFSLTYNKAKAIIDEMVNDERLVYDSGVTYNVKAEGPKKPTPVSRPNDGADMISNRFRQLRESLFRTTDGDETDDEDDDDEDTDFDEVIDALDSIEEDTPDNKEDKKSDKNSCYSLSHYFEVMKFKRLFSENFGDVVQQKIVAGEQISAIYLEPTRCFKLSFVDDEEYVKISDCGNTISEDSKNLKKALEIIKNYDNMIYAYGEISVTVHRNGDVLTALLELFAATERIKYIK